MPLGYPLLRPVIRSRHHRAMASYTQAIEFPPIPDTSSVLVKLKSCRADIAVGDCMHNCINRQSGLGRRTFEEELLRQAGFARVLSILEHPQCAGMKG